MVCCLAGVVSCQLDGVLLGGCDIVDDFQLSVLGDVVLTMMLRG